MRVEEGEDVGLPESDVGVKKVVAFGSVLPVSSYTKSVPARL